MSDANKAAFMCPRCGGGQIAHTIRRNPPGLLFGSQVKEKPWMGVLEILVCNGCGYHIPAHLGERWDGLTESGAEDEWLRLYRDDAVRESLP